MSKTKLQAEWEIARHDLGLEIEIAFDLDLENGVTIHSEVLLKHFGGRNGMLIVKEYAPVKHNLERIHKLGYGFSVLDEPRQAYDRNSMIEMLSDWGWAGSRDKMPSWIIPTQEHADDGTLKR